MKQTESDHQQKIKRLKLYFFVPHKVTITATLGGFTEKKFNTGEVK